MAPNPIPVGTILDVEITDPTQVQTAAWSGGTTYSGYDPGSPNQPPNVPVVLFQNVSTTNTEDYMFIIDATPRAYHISVTVNYVGGGSGTSTLDFSSALPTFRTNVVQPGNVSASVVTTTNNGQTVANYVVIGEVNDASGTQIQASTGPETNIFFAGDYMWLQLIQFSATIGQKVNNGVVEHTEQTMGLVIDDGTAGARANLGQPLVEGGNSWVSDPASELPYSTTGTFFDKPNLPDSSSPGTSNAMYDQGMSYTASFETYLMYQPPGGVWIAVQMYNWNFNIGATNATFGQANVPQQWNADANPTQPDPQPSTPGGSGAFPTWTNESFGTTWNPPFN